VVASQTGARYALKVEFLDAPKQALDQEVQVLSRLRRSKYFPTLITSGTFEDFRFLVMTLFGPSLSKVRRALPGHKYTTGNVLRLSLEMLNCIEALHDVGHIHRDIKPGNFLINPIRSRPICLIDFGLAQLYVNPKNGRHIPEQEGVGFAGTCRYASLNAHRERQLSRRDDLISWFYSTVELADGQLPWPGSRERRASEQSKGAIKSKKLCKALPADFQTIWQMISCLPFSADPDYYEIRRIIKRAIRDMESADTNFDWEALTKEQITALSPIPLEMQEGDAATEGGCCGLA
jgi:serine/threonine protein kinase